MIRGLLFPDRYALRVHLWRFNWILNKLKTNIQISFRWKESEGGGISVEWGRFCSTLWGGGSWDIVHSPEPCHPTSPLKPHFNHICTSKAKTARQNMGIKHQCPPPPFLKKRLAKHKFNRPNGELSIIVASEIWDHFFSPHCPSKFLRTEIFGCVFNSNEIWISKNDIPKPKVHIIILEDLWKRVTK